jgi:hypothetical protein
VQPRCEYASRRLLPGLPRSARCNYSLQGARGERETISTVSPGGALMWTAVCSNSPPTSMKWRRFLPTKWRMRRAHGAAAFTAVVGPVAGIHSGAFRETRVEESIKDPGISGLILVSEIQLQPGNRSE